MDEVLTLLIGLMVGYWARQVYDKLSGILSRLKAQKEYNKAGIVRPGVKSVPKRVDLSTGSGGVRSKTPDEYLIANMKDRDERIKRM